MSQCLLAVVAEDGGGQAGNGVVLALGAGAGGVLGPVAHLHAVNLDAGVAGEGNHVGAQGVQRPSMKGLIR